MEARMPGMTPPAGANYRMIGGGGARSPRDSYAAMTAAQAEYEALKSSDPFLGYQGWMPETRAVGRERATQYLVGDQWFDQSAWDDPSFQSAMVDPYRQAQEQKWRASRMSDHSRKLSEAQARAGMAQYDYDDYQQRQAEIQASRPGSRTIRPEQKMMGMGKGGY